MPVRRAWQCGGALALMLVLGVAAAAQSGKLNSKGQLVLGDGAGPGPLAMNRPVWSLAPPSQRLPNPSPAKIQSIIQTFATHERDFRQLLANNYTYTESILMQSVSDLGPGGQPTGAFQQVNNIVYVPGSGRQIVCTYCPQPTLTSINITPDDVTDMFNMNMYTFSIDELPQYNVTYLDHQHLDQITAYMFRVQPKKIVKGRRYFDGVVYVDDQSLCIVKSIGRVVPDIYDKKGYAQNTFLPFTVWRKEIDGKYWFPVYTLMQGEIPPSGPGEPPVPMRMVIQFKNYKRFGASARILSVQTDPNTPKKTNPKSKKGGGGGGL